MFSPVFDLFVCSQDEVNQIVTSNVRLRQVSLCDYSWPCIITLSGTAHHLKVGLMLWTSLKVTSYQKITSFADFDEYDAKQ